MSSVGDIATIPGELVAKFQTGFYADTLPMLSLKHWGWGDWGRTLVRL